MKASNEQPLGLALILCDRVITHAPTGEKTLVGTFNYIQSNVFPFMVPRMTVFAAVTNGKGVMSAEMKCVNLEDPSRQIFGMKGQIPFKDPLEVVEMGFEFHNLIFPRPGTHSVDFLIDGILILPRRFLVSMVEPGQQK